MSLVTLSNSFIEDMRNIIVRRATIIQNDYSLDVWKRMYLTESLVSDVWQRWCDYCRSIIHESCMGTTAKQGRQILPRSGDNRWQRISYEAMQASQGNQIRSNNTRTITYLRQEPTWGDISKLIPIIQQVQPNNESQLLTAFGLPLNGPKHLQTVRNACAHKNTETLSDVNHLIIYYNISTFLRAPYELAWEIKRNSSSLGIYSWVDDMITMANQVTL